MQSEELINNVARRIYEDRHAGMNNIWNWDDNGLDDEHPGVRAQYEGYAKSAIAALSAAIKTMLNGRATLHPPSEAALSAQVQDVARDLPSEFEKWWDDAGHYVGGVVKMTYTQRKQIAWDAFYASANPAAPAKQEG